MNSTLLHIDISYIYMYIPHFYPDRGLRVRFVRSLPCPSLSKHLFAVLHVEYRVQYGHWTPQKRNVVAFGSWIFKLHPIPHAIEYKPDLCQKVGFSTMSAIALAPLTCYTHPNQKQSLLKYPNVCLGHTSSVFFCRHAFGHHTRF